MLSALLQTIANLGIDVTKINETFNGIVNTIAGGDISSVSGINDIMTGMISVFTGLPAGDITTILQSLIQSVAEVLSNDASNNILSAITGA